MTTSSQQNPLGTFEEYRLVRPIGRGGMGDVFLAHDTVLDRLVAVKFMAQFAPDSSARERFLIEARAAARIQHPNVMAIYRVGELDHRPYLVTEYIHGDTMEALPKPVPWKRALELGIGLSRGLAAAHRRGVLHRDIKPGNIVITEHGDVKLLDFGLAKLFDESSRNEEPSAPADSIVVRPAEAARPSRSSLEVNQRAETNPAWRWSMESTQVSPAASTATDNPRSPWDARTMSPSHKEQAVDGKAQNARLLSSPLTLTGCVVGTPAYVPPELWAGEPASPRSDVHQLGAVLYELCIGFAPTAGIALENLPQFVQECDIPPLCMVVPEVDPRLGAVIDRCLLRDPARRFASGDELREALEKVAHAVAEHAIPDGNPYRGLAVFRAEHRALFFGRDREIHAIVDRLRSEHCIVVAGHSGVGKSSLCQAGVLPLIRDGVLAQGRSWTVLQFVPGRRPLAALAEAFAEVVGMDEDALVAGLRAEPDKLVQALRKRWHGTGIVIFVDQLEELFTMSDPVEAIAVSRALGLLVAGIAGVRLLMTLRSDFLASIASLPGLDDEISRGLCWLRPMSPDHLREAIIGPARARGVTFESDALVETLAESTAGAGGGMPLLQLALAELWDARDTDKPSLTPAALDRIGGVAGAVARHADDILLGLRHRKRAAAQKILTALVSAQGRRLRRTEAELAATDPCARETLDALVRGRLLLTTDASNGTEYEIACEALITGWDTLRHLLDEQADSRIVSHRLQIAIEEWERLGRTRDALWSMRQLQEASALDPKDLTSREKLFLETSRRSLRRDRLKHHVVIACMPFAIAVAHGAVRFDAQRLIDDQAAVQIAHADINESAPQARNENAEARFRTAFAATADAPKDFVDMAPERFISSSLDREDAVLPRCLTAPSTHSQGARRPR